LRDVGYDFVHAVADLVDNSVAANASEIAIDMRFDGEDSWLRIADNGRGMSGSEINEAMRFGTDRDYDTEDLGKFGLGLKTASLSQCSRLTVASRIDPSSRRIEVRQWDLEHVTTTNKWEIINIPADERSSILVDPLQERVGTVVLWDRMDRVLEYKVPWGERARSSFLQTVERLDLHLGMVFHRFLSGEARRRKKLTITINGTTVEPWDPFARDEKATIAYADHQFEVQDNDGRGLVGYTAFVLPHQDYFSSMKAFNRYAGPAKWNFQQGFYIYRADRMIQSGGWCRLRTSDEHTKLARIALDFRTDMDSAFELNISKARVSLPVGLRNQLRSHVEELVKQARKVYGSGVKTSSQPPRDGASGNTGGTSSVAPSSRSYPPSVMEGRMFVAEKAGALAVAESREIPAGPQRKRIGRALESAAARIGETSVLNRIRKALREDDPEMANDIGW
jgi:hypothetical protein